MRVNILHLSDLHASQATVREARRVVGALIKDIGVLEEQQGVRPDLICFTGDIIQSGDQADDQFGVASSILFEPLLQATGLSKNQLLVVPGNHEVDRRKTSEIFENGLQNRLKGQTDFEEFLHHCTEENAEFQLVKQRLTASQSLINAMACPEYKVATGFFYNAYVIPIGRIQVGVLGLNSAWRSSQFGNDLGRLILGRTVLEEGCEYLNGCDLRIALAHHPLEMLTEWDREAIKPFMAQHIDLFLSGHIHCSDMVYMKPILGSFLASTCSSLYSGRIRNGYSFLSVDIANREVTLWLRRWYDVRQEFDQETEKCQGGQVTLTGFSCTSVATNDLVAIYQIRRSMIQSLTQEEALVTPITLNESIGLEEVFVEPLISDEPPFNRSVDYNQRFYGLLGLLDKKANLAFCGGKEYGKTTLLRYIKSIMLHDDRFEEVIPVYLRFEELPRNNPNAIGRLISSQLAVGTTQATRYLQGGRILLLVDDYGSTSVEARENRKRVLRSFLDEHPNCRWIITFSESLVQAFTNDPLQLAAEKFYLMPLNASKVRELVSKWSGLGNFNADEMLQLVLYYFSQLQIPVTPMAVTLLIGVLFRDTNTRRDMRNEAYLIENYLEAILGKLSLDEGNLSFDFRDKESFLAYIAYRMVQKESYEWNRVEFEDEKNSYFKHYGQDLPASQQFEELFSRGILQDNNGMISFKFKFWFNFSLAKAMQRSSEILSEILARKDYLKYATALSYKAGLSRNDESLLALIVERANAMIPALLPSALAQFLQDGEVDSSLALISKEMELALKEDRSNTQDKLNDNTYLDYDPAEQKYGTNEFDGGVTVLTLSSDILRTSKEVPLVKKQECLQLNIKHYIAMLLVTLDGFRAVAQQLDEKELAKTLFGDSTSDADNTLGRVNHLIYRLVPLSVLLYASNHLSNPHLKNALIVLFDHEDEEFAKTFYGLLLLTVDLATGIEKIESLVDGKRLHTTDFIMYMFLWYFGVGQSLDEQQLDSIVVLMYKIRRKHAQTPVRPLPFLKDTILSDLKKDFALRKITRLETAASSES